MSTLNRTVFKIFASLGPAGSIPALSEKAFRKLFSAAYDLGDPNVLLSIEESHIKKLR